jgi:hypothetical protein
VQIVVWANSLNDDAALIVSGLITGGCLGPTMLVVPEADFKRLASRTHWNDQPIYSMSFGMHPRSDSRWLPYLVPSERLVERFMPEKMSIQELVRPPQWRSDLGFLGESETVRLLAEGSALNLFRPFPDLETSELAILHMGRGRLSESRSRPAPSTPPSPRREFTSAPPASVHHPRLISWRSRGCTRKTDSTTSAS